MFARVLFAALALPALALASWTNCGSASDHAKNLAITYVRARGCAGTRNLLDQ
jgi:hypothetical protein